MNKKWLTLEELAAYIGVSVRKLYDIRRKGQNFPSSSRATGRERFDVNDIDDWMRNGIK